MTTRSWSASHAPCARTPPTASARSEMTARLLYVSHFARSRRTTPRTALANFVTRADCCPTPAGIQAQTRAARGQREYVRDKACRARHAPAVPVRHSGERAGQGSDVLAAGQKMTVIIRANRRGPGRK